MKPQELRSLRNSTGGNVSLVDHKKNKTRRKGREERGGSWQLRFPVGLSLFEQKQAIWNSFASPNLTLLEQFLPLAKSHSLPQGLCREDTDLVDSLARPVHIASGGRGASAWSLWTLRKERFAMGRCSSCCTSTNPCDCGQPNSGGPRTMQN